MPGCAAPNCSNRSEQGFRVFRFPADAARRSKWVQNVRRDDWEPTDGSRLCQKHFEDSQFENARADNLKKLRPDAVPTLFDDPNPPPKITRSPKKSLYKVEADVENYVKYQLVGGRMILKSEVLPHRFDCQQVLKLTEPRINVAKSQAQRSKEYRDRLRFISNSKAIGLLPKSSAQRSREYRERKRLLRLINSPATPPPPPPKTSAQRSKEYRERKRLRDKNKTDSTAARKMREYRQRRRKVDNQNGECSKWSQSASSDLTHEALQIKSEPEAYFLPESLTTDFLPESSGSPMFSAEISEATRRPLKPVEVEKSCKAVEVEESHKFYCRICLKQHDKNAFLPLSLGAMYHSDPSEQFKVKMIEQVEHYQEVLGLVIPDFDYSITFNPIICKDCHTRLMNAYDFIKECRSNENLIKYYKEKHAPQENSFTIDDVVHAKSQLIKEISDEDKQKTSKKRTRQAIAEDTVEQHNVFVEHDDLNQPLSLTKTESVDLSSPEYIEVDDEFTEEIKCSKKYNTNNDNSGDVKIECHNIFDGEIVTVKEEFGDEELATTAVVSPSQCQFSSFSTTKSETGTDQISYMDTNNLKQYPANMYILSLPNYFFKNSTTNQFTGKDNDVG